MRITRRFAQTLLLSLWLTGPALAGPLASADVPEPLKPWIGWALHGSEARFCPPQHNNDGQRLCHWPSQLTLALDAKGGRFESQVRQWVDGWHALPGDGPRWPQNVMVDGAAAAVSERGGTPHIWLTAGKHRVQGEFQWTRVPESLRLPPDSGLVKLSLSGQSIAHPQRDNRNQLWLGKRQATANTQADRLSIRVFRMLDDDIPFSVTTQIEMDVGGDVREEVIGPALLDGLTPLSLGGALPARIEEDGRLRLQVRPGRWTITLQARSSAPVSSLKAVKIPKPWPEQEIWSLQNHHDLRVIEASGASPTDPRQSGVPGPWQNLPAFLIEPGTELSLKQTQRGSAEVSPDELHLNRQLWLDFSGKGFTLQDHLRGKIARSWRLDAVQPISLGRVQVDGEPQLITQHDGAVGVEVRHGQLDMSADSRIDGTVRSLPAGGWTSDLQGVETVLHLPPAWRLLAAPGVDNVPDTWLSRWTLLDLFLVLIASIAALRLLGRKTALLSLVTLGLIWHEPGAPRWVWLNLIAAIALLRALPVSLDSSGRLHKLLQAYQWISVGVVVFVALPFVIDQARTSLYPQLENQRSYSASRGSSMGYAGVAAPTEMADAEVMMAEEMAMAPPPPSVAKPAMKTLDSRVRVQSASAPPAPTQAAQANIQKLDPKVLTQTGPGLPNWNWSQTRLHWSGPVTQEQDFQLWLMPPWLTRTLGWLSIVLIALLLARLLRLPMKWPRPQAPASSATSVVFALVMMTGLLCGLAPSTALAAQARISPAPSEPATPDPSILDQLRERLTAAPDCMPDCADFSRMRIDVSGDAMLSIRLTAEAQIPTALPLPVPPLSRGQNKVWQPSQVLLGAESADLLRDNSGQLWLRLPPGRHEVVLRGSLEGFTELQLPMSSPARNVSYSSPGWLLTGVDKDGQSGNAITLVRERRADEKPSEAADIGGQSLPPLLRLSRTLQLGLVWEVQSSLTRQGDAQGAYIATVAALPGEVVTGSSVKRIKDQIQVSFAPGQRSIGWASRLPTSEALSLKASSSGSVFETWNFDVSPLWHVDFSGIPAISNQQNQWRLVSFRPWPKEEVLASIARPKAVAGRILTLDLAELMTRPGKRATDHELRLSLRASQGGQHNLPIPENAQVQSVNIDGQDVPARIEANQVVLPLRPGQQNIFVKLRVDQGLQTLSRVPALELGLSGTNAELSMQLPPDRWILFAGGPALGPAVLFWGLLAVLLAVAIALGQTGMTPLKGLQWALLMLGLSQLPIFGAALVAGWLFALSLRQRIPEHWSAVKFNAVQVGLALWTVLAVATLFGAVAQGLLGSPDMQVAGNGSSEAMLRWYQDRFENQLPGAWALSVSIWFYRGLMLLWALWLANSLLNWLRWGWTQYSTGGLWKKRDKALPKAETN